MLGVNWFQLNLYIFFFKLTKKTIAVLVHKMDHSVHSVYICSDNVYSDHQKIGSAFVQYNAIYRTIQNVRTCDLGIYNI